MSFNPSKKGGGRLLILYINNTKSITPAIALKKEGFPVFLHKVASMLTIKAETMDSRLFCSFPNKVISISNCAFLCQAAALY